jgi:hypothetical protein
MSDNLPEGYYKINNTKRILYWNGTKWQKPEKDHRKEYSGWLSELEKQPKIKSVEEIIIHRK